MLRWWTYWIRRSQGTTITDSINLQIMMVMYYTMETNMHPGGRTPSRLYKYVPG